MKHGEVPYQKTPADEEMAYESATELQRIMSQVRFEVLDNPELKGRKIVFIMRGVPGSGKSTVAKEIAHTDPAIHSTDSYFMDQKGQYKFDPSKLGENHQKNLDSFKKSLEAGRAMIVVDNTNIRRFEFEVYVEAAKAMGYAVKEVPIPFPDPSVAAKRNSHGVPEETIRRMMGRFEA